MGVHGASLAPFGITSMRGTVRVKLCIHEIEALQSSEFGFLPTIDVALSYLGPLKSPHFMVCLCLCDQYTFTHCNLFLL